MKSISYVGIDISKLTFDVAIIDGSGRYHSYKFTNDSSGFRRLLQKAKEQTCHFVMEASGPYYLKLATFLNEAGYAVSVVNPLIIRRFCQMKMMRAKTDKKDAVMIAEYGRIKEPDCWLADQDYVLELKQLQAYLDQLNKQRTSFIRQQEAFKQNTVVSKEVKSGTTKFIRAMDKEAAKIEHRMISIISLHHQQMFDHLQSIPGLGKKTSMLLIVLTGAFEKFDNAKQISSYFGLSPRIYESGTSIKGRARICKMGMGKMRQLLYMCAMNAKRANKACKDLYDRLIEKGKSGKLALIAVANKLVKQAFALATKQQFYNSNYSPNACF